MAKPEILKKPGLDHEENSEESDLEEDEELMVKPKLFGEPWQRLSPFDMELSSDEETGSSYYSGQKMLRMPERRPLNPWENESDEDLPDLDMKIPTYTTCCCSVTTGKTVLECAKCRLCPSPPSKRLCSDAIMREPSPPYLKPMLVSPVPVKAASDRHFMDSFDQSNEKLSPLKFGPSPGTSFAKILRSPFKSLVIKEEPVFEPVGKDEVIFIDDELPDLTPTEFMNNECVSSEKEEIVTLKYETRFVETVPDLEVDEVEEEEHTEEKEYDHDYIHDSESESDEEISATKERVGRTVRAQTQNKSIIDVDSDYTKEYSDVLYTNRYKDEETGRTVTTRHPRLLDELEWPGPVLSVAHLPLHGSTDPIGITRRVHEFTDATTNIVHACYDEVEYNKNYAAKGAELLKDFCQICQEPPPSLIKTLLFEVMPHTHMPQKVYNVLLLVLGLYPPGELAFTWSDLEVVISGLRMPFGISSLEGCVLHYSTLTLSFIVESIKAELEHRSLLSQRHIMKCFIYKQVVNDFRKVQQLILWISDSLQFGEYEEFDEVAESFLTLGVSPNSDAATDHTNCASLASSDCPKILPLLMTLVNLIIIVNRDPPEIAKRIAGELVRVYMRTQSLLQRQLLLTSIVSPLLKFKVAQRILEDHCGNAVFGGSQVRLDDVLRLVNHFNLILHSITPAYH